MNAGVDGLAHLPIAKLAEPQWVNALKAYHTFVITTITFTDFHLTAGRLAAELPSDPFIAPYLGPATLEGLAQPQWHNEPVLYSISEENLRNLRDAGVPLLAGTDASNSDPAGALLHTELELIVKAGLKAEEVLADATSVPAQIFSLHDRAESLLGFAPTFSWSAAIQLKISARRAR